MNHYPRAKKNAPGDAFADSLSFSDITMSEPSEPTGQESANSIRTGLAAMNVSIKELTKYPIYLFSKYKEMKNSFPLDVIIPDYMDQSFVLNMLWRPIDLMGTFLPDG